MKILIIGLLLGLIPIILFSVAACPEMNQSIQTALNIIGSIWTGATGMLASFYLFK